MGQIGIAQAQLSAASVAGSTSAGSTEITDGTYRVGGLVGVTVGTSSLSLQADTVELWRSTDRTKRYVIGSSAIVNDIATTGLNGRDQSTSFGASNWIHFYYVGPNTVTSSSLATRSSLVAPPTGPTLPSSETHWAYAGAVRLNASTQLVATELRGSSAWYLSDISVLAGGTSTSATAVDVSTVIPPNALSYLLALAILTQSGSGAALNSAIDGYVSSSTTLTTTTFMFHVNNIVNVANEGSRAFLTAILPNALQTFYYLAAGTGAQFFIGLDSYKTPNGGE